MTEIVNGTSPALHREEVVAHVRDLFLKTAEDVGHKFGRDAGIDHLGGYVCLMNTAGSIKLLMPVGKPDPEEADGYRRNAVAKCQAMYDRRNDRDCISSWSCRDANANPPIWGGGIKLGRLDGYLSISGYPELVDEAYCLAAMLHREFLSDERVLAILGVSGGSMQLVNDIRSTILLGLTRR